MQVVASVSRLFRPPFILGLLAVSVFLVNAQKQTHFTPHEKAYYADPKIIASEMPGRQKEHLVEGTITYRHEGMESTVAHMGHFLESIRTRKPYWEDARAGHHAASCAHMINLAAREKRMVEWDFAADTIKA